MDAAVAKVVKASPAALRVYPDPVRKRLSVYLPGEGNFRLRIYNMQGETVLEKSAANHDPLEMRVADLPGGMCVISVHAGSRVMTGRFVKTESAQKQL